MMMIQLISKQVMDIVIIMDQNGYGYMPTFYKLKSKYIKNKIL